MNDLSGDYTVRVMDDLDMWDRNLVRLIVRRRIGYSTEYLMENGTWERFEEGNTVTGGVGVLLPRAALDAVALGIEQWQGHTNHSDTEARVLREWLKSEKDRVDTFLAR